MSLATRCTRCGTVFRVVPDQLRVSEGWVRCGRCSAVFNAVENLVDTHSGVAAAMPGAGEGRATPTPVPAAGAPPMAPVAPPGPGGWELPAAGAIAAMRARFASPAAGDSALPPDRADFAPTELPVEAGWADDALDIELDLGPAATQPLPGSAAERVGEAGLIEGARTAGDEGGGAASDFGASGSGPWVGAEGALATPSAHEDGDAEASDEAAAAALASAYAGRNDIDFGDGTAAGVGADPEAGGAGAAGASTAPGPAFEADDSGLGGWTEAAHGHDPVAPVSFADQAPDSTTAAAWRDEVDLQHALTDAPAADLPQGQGAEEPDPTDRQAHGLEADTTGEERIEPTALRDEPAREQAVDEAIQEPRDSLPADETTAAEPAPHWAAARMGADAVPSFVRSAERAERWRRSPARAALAGAVLLAAAGLAGQGAYQWRDRLAAQVPALQPALAQACNWLGCTLQPPRVIDALVVDSSALLRVEHSALYALDVVLRNRGGIAVAVPALDLQLTDARGRLLVRRVLTAAELGSPAPALAAGGQLALQATLEHQGTAVAGYTIELFYP